MQHVMHQDSKGSASNQVKKKSPGFECGLCGCVDGEPRTHTSTCLFSNISSEFQPRETCLNFLDPQCCSWSHKDLYARLGSLWHSKSATCTLHTTRSSKGISHCKADYLHSVVHNSIATIKLSTSLVTFNYIIQGKCLVCIEEIKDIIIHLGDQIHDAENLACRTRS